MSVTSISRDSQNNVSIVRMITSDNLATVVSANYIENQMPNIRALNSGFWQWYSSDMLLVSASDGNAFFTFTDSTFSSLVEYSGGGGGGVTSLQVQDLAFNYAVDSGPGNGINYVGVYNPAITSYSNNQIFYLSPSSQNFSQSVTFDAGAGAKSVFPSPLAALTVGDILSDEIAIFNYSVADDCFYLLNPLNELSTLYHQFLNQINSVSDSGAANAYVANNGFFPTNFISSGTLVYLSVANTNTGASTFNYNGQGALAVTLPNGSPLTGGEMVANGISTLVNSSATNSWQLLNSASGVATSTQIQDQAFTSAVDSGAANALAITLSPAPGAYVEGQLFTVRAANNNSGATTLNVNTLGAKAVYTAGSNACVGGEIVGGSTYLFEYNGALNAFILINPSNIITNQAPQIQNQKFIYAVDSGAANAYVVTLSPAPGAYVDGQLVSFRAANANSGASTINVNGLGVTPIVTNANAALASGAILLNGTYNLEYNSSFGSFVLINSSASAGGGVTAAQIQDQTYTYFQDSGSANTYAITASPAIGSYADGQSFQFKAANNNTGVSTFNVNGIGAVSLYTTNLGTGVVPNNLTSGQILSGIIYSVTYNSSLNSGSGGFYLNNPSNTSQNPQIGSIQNNSYNTSTASGSANTYTASLNPAIGSYINGLSIQLTMGSSNANTGASTINVNSIGTANIVYGPGNLFNKDLVGSELRINSTYTLIYNNSIGAFMLMNPSLAIVNATEAANAVTANGLSGKITTSSLSTAAGSSYAITWTNSFLSASSIVILSLMGGSNTTKNITLQFIRSGPTNTLTIYNTATVSALNGSVIIAYQILS